MPDPKCLPPGMREPSEVARVIPSEWNLTHAIAARDDAWRQELARVERERDAYKRAKAENDERLMIERDDARAALEQARAVAVEAATLDLIGVVEARRLRNLRAAAETSGLDRVEHETMAREDAGVIERFRQLMEDERRG